MRAKILPMWRLLLVLHWVLVGSSANRRLGEIQKNFSDRRIDFRWKMREATDETAITCESRTCAMGVGHRLSPSFS
jgi:hypothetical protein